MMAGPVELSLSWSATSHASSMQRSSRGALLSAVSAEISELEIEGVAVHREQAATDAGKLFHVHAKGGQRKRHAARSRSER